MARIIPLGTLVGRCQKRADKEGDPSVDEWKPLISEMYGELYEAVADVGSSYFEATHDITATGAAAYDAPEDELSIVSVDQLVGGELGARPSLRLLMAQERARWAGITGDARFYAFAGSQIALYPRPASGVYRVTYAPQAPDLSTAADSTDVDVVNSAGEAFLVWGVAAMAKDKSEADLRFAAQRADAARVRLQSWAINRALHETRRRVVHEEGVDRSDEPQPGNDAGGWLY